MQARGHYVDIHVVPATPRIAAFSECIVHQTDGIMARILIIDAHETTRTLIASFLRTYRHTVRTVVPAFALEALRAAEFDCIVLASPIVTAEQSLIIDEIAKAVPHLLPKVIVTTAEPDNEKLLRRAASLRVYAVMAKPFDPRDLIHLVELSAERIQPPHRWYSISREIVEGVAAGLPDGGPCW